MNEPIRTVLWSADSVQQNNTSITLIDSIDNYDEIIYLGSGTRNFSPCVMTCYPVVPNSINLGGPYFCGKWGSAVGDTWLLSNGTQCFVSGNSGYIASSYYFGISNGSTAWGASLTNNRVEDVRPYAIIGLKYNDNSRTLLWSAADNTSYYNSNITLSEPITHFEEFEVIGSGYENDGSVGCRHTGKQIYNTQNNIIGCDAWAYSPWKFAERHNLMIGTELKISGNSGHIGSGYYFGMGNQSTAYAAGRWDNWIVSALQPCKIYGVKHKPILRVVTVNGTDGVLSSNISSGCEYDTATLSYTANDDKYLSGIDITGAQLQNLKFTLTNSNVTAAAKWMNSPFNITYSSDGNGTLTGDSTTGEYGKLIQLTPTPASNYELSGYEVTGATITGNTACVQNSDVIVTAKFKSAYKLLLQDLRTLGQSNATQTLGSQINLTNLEHRYICIKFGATNNQNGAGAYNVNMNSAQPNTLRWHSYSSRISKRAPLCYGRSSVNAQYNAMYKNASGELYFATNSTSFSSGVWAQYKIVIDLQTKYCRVWETTSNSYVEYYLGAIPTTFNNVSCNGDSGSYRSALRNLYVYSASTWDLALSL